MADKISAEILARLITNIEASIKELDVREVTHSIKRTKDIELIFNRTSDTIKKTKNLLNRTVDIQIFGKDN